jgi:uncharacterized membrane protein HdeD (DUF308 family)
MSDSQPVGTPVEQLAAAGRSWGWLLAFGIITLLTGIIVLAWPGPTVLVIAVVFGVQLLVGGLFWFVSALASEEKHTATRILLAVLAIVVGVVVLRSPATVALLLPLVLGLFWMVSGIIETFHALVAREITSRGWAVASGLLGLLAGIVLLAYPGVGLVTMTYLLGVWLVIYGGIAIGRAVRMRPHAAPAATTPGTAPA